MEIEEFANEEPDIRTGIEIRVNELFIVRSGYVFYFDALNENYFSFGLGTKVFKTMKINYAVIPLVNIGLKQYISMSMEF